MSDPGDTLTFDLGERSLGAACWWMCRLDAGSRGMIEYEGKTMSYETLVASCFGSLFEMVEILTTQDCRQPDTWSKVCSVATSMLGVGDHLVSRQLADLAARFCEELLETIYSYVLRSECPRGVLTIINRVLSRHHLPLLVCAVPSLLPREHTHARLANGLPPVAKAPKGSFVSPSIVLGDATSLSMTEPFEHWYDFEPSNSLSADEESCAAEKVLLGDFESFLRKNYLRQPALWKVSALSSFRVCRPSSTVTFPPTRFSPCYGLRAIASETTSEDVTKTVAEKIISAPSPTQRNEKSTLATSFEDISGSIVRIPSKHPLHPLICSFVQNQDESTMLVGDPTAELGSDRPDDANGDAGGSSSGGSSVAAIISKLPPHPLRGLVQGMEDFMIQNDQRHRRLVQFVDFLCRRCDGSMTLMLKALPARHRTRLNAAILDAFEKDDEDCLAVLSKPHLWETSLKDFILREFAVSVALRPSTLASVSLIMTSTGAGVLYEQINRHVALAEEMVKGSYTVLAAASRLSEVVVAEEDKESAEARQGVDCATSAGTSSTSAPYSLKGKSKAPTVTLPFPIERSARFLVERIGFALSDSSLEFGSLLRVPPAPVDGSDLVQPFSITVQSFATCPIILGRLRKLTGSAFPLQGCEEASLQHRFALALENIVFGLLLPLITREMEKPLRESRRPKKHSLRPHHLMCLEALLVLLDTMAAVEKGCDSSVIDAFYDGFVSDKQSNSVKEGKEFGGWIPPAFCVPIDVIQWLTGTPSPYYLSSLKSHASQQTASSAAGLTALGLMVEALAARCYVCTVCDTMLRRWDSLDDEEVSEDEIGATGALREFNFVIDIREDSMRKRFSSSLNARNRAILLGVKRRRESGENETMRYSAAELVTGNVAENASFRYAHSMLLTMPDTLTITQVYEGY